MSQKQIDAVVEGLKEFIRTLLLGMLPVFGAVLLFIKSGINIEVGTFNINWMIAVAMLVSGFLGVFQTALMSAADKWLHKTGVETPLDLKALDSLK